MSINICYNYQISYLTKNKKGKKKHIILNFPMNYMSYNLVEK